MVSTTRSNQMITRCQSLTGMSVARIEGTMAEKKMIPDTATTRDLNQAQIYAWRKGIKTLYYIRIRQQALEGTEVAGCVSCML